MSQNQAHDQMSTFEYEDEFIVIDGRIKPFVSIPRNGIICIAKGNLDIREIGVYIALNMINDGTVKINSSTTQCQSVAKIIGLTERQVKNVFKKLSEKNLVTIIDSNTVQLIYG